MKIWFRCACNRNLQLSKFRIVLLVKNVHAKLHHILRPARAKNETLEET